MKCLHIIIIIERNMIKKPLGTNIYFKNLLILFYLVPTDC